MCDKSLEKLIKYDGTPSLTDVVALEVMDDKKIDKIVSFVSDFEKIDNITRIH